MEKLDDILTALKKLETRLFRQILSSFAFSLLAVLAQYDKFNIQFKALTEILGGTMGAAGILSAYLGSIKHASEDHVLDFQPTLLGFRTAVGLLTSAGLFYGFYAYAQQKKPVCILFLAAGVFLFFRTLTKSVLIIQAAEKQTFFWNAMSKEDRIEWLRARYEQKKVAEQVHQTLRDTEQFLEETKATLKRSSAETRRLRWESRIQGLRFFFERLWRQSYRFRKKLRLTTMGDAIAELRGKQALKELEIQIHRDNLRKIRSGEIKGESIEGSDLRIFRVDAWTYFDLPETANEQSVSNYLQHLNPLKKDTPGHFQYLVAVRSQSTDLSVQAREALEGSGITLLEENPASH